MAQNKMINSAVIFIVYFAHCGAILNGGNPFSYEDITLKPEFGCQWGGGSSGGNLTCICQDYAQEFFIQEGSLSSYTTVTIYISNCNAVRFGLNSVLQLRNLRNIQLVNIKSLNFDESALTWDGSMKTTDDQTEPQIPGLKISVRKTTIDRISSYTFKGRANEIAFDEVVFEDIAPFAFSTLVGLHKIEFTNCVFKNIQAQAFKKFATGDLIVSGTVFGLVPSRAFSDVVVFKNFIIKNSTFDVIKPAGFIIRNVKRFEVRDTSVNTLEGEGFKVMTRGSVNFINNVFNATHSGAFLGISLNKEEVYTDELITFDTNVFNDLHKDSLRINSTSFSAKFINILLNQSCDCNYINRVLQDSNLHSEVQCLYEGGYIVLDEFKKDNCSIVASYATIIIILGVCLILFIIIVSVLAVYFKRVFKNKKRKEYINGKDAKNLNLIVPDGRTYRETELHVIVERADLLTTDL